MRASEESLKPGTTASERRILAGVTGSTSPPENGNSGYAVNGRTLIHLAFTLGGTDSPAFALQLWWYSKTSLSWHAGETFTVADSGLITVETKGLDRIYVEVTGVTGTDPTLSGWGIRVVETP
ncbi:hypothetical protein EBT31_16330 [bacterium]|nr:hypothetical protein [bacterium]